MSLQQALRFHIDVHRSHQRFHTQISWFDSHHSFSFADHYDLQNPPSHGLLLVSNDDMVRPEMGFSTHPHHDMEIVTWVLDGGGRTADDAAGWKSHSSHRG
jgi:quercetin 2,3-dioxygenase